MADSTVWWVLAGVVIALELLSGTFYLLMLALGLVAAAVSSHLGAPLTLQLVTAALVGGGCVLAWWVYQQKRPPQPPASANHDVNLDIGARVQVDHWAPDATSEVAYRGANWQVALAPGETALPGPHTIIEIIGSRLIVKRAA